MSSFVMPTTQSTAQAAEGHCYICSSMLGKRRLNPRHHCRVCYKAVCATCSSSRVPLDGHAGLHRICTPCAMCVSRSPAFCIRLQSAAQRLLACSDMEPEGRNDVQANDLERAVLVCESSTIQASSCIQALKVEVRMERHMRQQLELRGQGDGPIVRQQPDVQEQVANGDGGACEICKRVLGKRYCRPRHHCRICARLVCGACSPSRVSIDGLLGVHRACTECAVVAQKAPMLAFKLQKHVGRLHVLASARTGVEIGGISEQSASLEQAIERCEFELDSVCGINSHARTPNAEIRAPPLQQIAYGKMSWRKFSAWQQSQAPPPKLDTCIVCESNTPSDTPVCSMGVHAMCAACFECYARAEFEQSDVVTRQRGARLLCPNRAPHEANCMGCFSDQMMARFLPAELYDTHMKRLREQIRSEESATATNMLIRMVEQLKQDMPNMSQELLERQMQEALPDALQCGQCGFGPIEHFACSDLQTHHGERIGAVQINNSCPECGFFAPNVASWPKWDGKIRSAAVPGALNNNFNRRTTSSTDEDERRSVYGSTVSNT